MAKRWGILFSACMILWYAPASAVTIGVTTLTDEQITNGQCSLREALINANNDNQSGASDCLAGSGADIINFKENLTGTVTLVTALPSISQDLTIKGRTDLTIAISGNYTIRVFDIIPGLTVTLRDLVITKGSAYHGGGIYSPDSILNIEHCRIIDNWGRGYTFGGGIYNYKGTVNIIDSEFSENGADMGGAISSDGTLNIIKCKFHGNLARVGSGILIHGKTDITDSEFSSNKPLQGAKVSCSGCGISNSGELTIKNSSVSDHKTDYGEGAGIYNLGKAVLIGVTVKGNSAGSGGGISNRGTLQLLDGTIVEGNSSDCVGGGIENSQNGTVEIMGAKGACKILNNKAVNAGGGIYSSKATVKIHGNFEGSGNEISGNTAATGGGILTYQGNLDISDATISYNNANNGGGLYLNGASTLIRVALLENNVLESGAGAYTCAERIYMRDVLFDKNEAKKDGSGIYNKGNLEVLRGTFSNNTFYSSSTQGNGGGIYNEGTANVSSSTFFENYLGKGGGIYNNGPLKVTGCTFSRNWGGDWRRHIQPIHQRRGRTGSQYCQQHAVE